MEKIIIHARPEDILRIRVNCRCGARSIAEVARMVAKASCLHVCPACGATYIIRWTKKETGNTPGRDGKFNWHITRRENIEETQVGDVQAENTYTFHCGNCHREVTFGQLMTMASEGRPCPHCRAVLSEDERKSILKGGE